MAIPHIEASSRVYQGAVITVEVDTLSGADGTQFTREVAVVSDAVAVVAIDERGRILLIKQYRHPMKECIWELPAGKMDVEGEAPEQTALRELCEEADILAGCVKPLTTFVNSAGWATEKTHVFLASELEPVAEFERQHEEVDIEKAWIPLQEAVTLAKDGTLTDAKTIIGILLAGE